MMRKIQPAPRSLAERVDATATDSFTEDCKGELSAEVKGVATKQTAAQNWNPRVQSLSELQGGAAGWHGTCAQKAPALLRSALPSHPPCLGEQRSRPLSQEVSSARPERARAKTSAKAARKASSEWPQCLRNTIRTRRLSGGLTS